MSDVLQMPTAQDDFEGQLILDFQSVLDRLNTDHLSKELLTEIMRILLMARLKNIGLK